MVLAAAIAVIGLIVFGIRKNMMFPLQADSLVVVIDGQTPERAEQAALSLGAALRREPQLFSDVDVPGTGDFFAQNAFLYLTEPELDDLSNRLVEAQPFLGLI